MAKKLIQYRNATKKPPRILLGIPCFNEEKVLAKTIHDIKQGLRGVFGFIEILVFDDGSTDNSVKAALKANVRVHEESVNQGLGINFRTMVQHAIAGNYDYMVTCDADGQFDSLAVQKVIKVCQTFEYDLVLGSRFLSESNKNDIPTPRVFGNYVVRKLVQLMSGKFVSDATCGLRAYNRKALLHLNPKEEFSYTIESLVQLITSRIHYVEVPIRVTYFLNRNSNISNSLTYYGFKTLSIVARLLLTASLTRILKLASLLILPAVVLLALFFMKSAEAGMFSGNLYLGLSGFALGAFSLGSFFFYLLSNKLDIVLLKNIELKNSISSIEPECRKCIFPIDGDK